MQFRTEVGIERHPAIRLSHGKGAIALLGSCFADNIAERLRTDLFDVVANPFGTLYNPLSVLRHLQGKEFTADDIFEDADGVFHSWHHGSALSAPTAEDLLRRINAAAADFRLKLQSAQALFVTYGTSQIFTLKSASVAVANCHKAHPSLFCRRRLSVDETADIVRRTVEAVAPLPVVFTVSPVRYIAPSLHDSQLAKATLLLGIEAARAQYFPAYEAVTDDLRDYRFYADDLIHPSKMAADYVYGLFAQTYFDPADAPCLALCRKYSALAAHRPIIASRADEHARRLEEMKQTLADNYGIHP